MERTRLRILFVDDSRDDAELLIQHLRRGQLDVEACWVDSAKEFKHQLESASWDAILCDYSMKGFDAPRALEILREVKKDIPCILVSGSIGEERAVEMMRLGAHDFVLKDRLGRLEPVIWREIADAKEREHRRRVEKSLAEANLSLSRLKRFFPPQIAEFVMSGKIEDPFKWHRGEVIVLFIDLRGFTQFSEDAPADQVMNTLQSYYTQVAQIAHETSGSIGHLAGDGIMMFFNDPVPLNQPRQSAVLAALKVRKALEKWWGSEEKSNIHNLNFGMGIADGTATIGGIGEEGCWDYTVVGTVSNLASRLCTQAKDGQILVSHRFLCRLENGFTSEDMGQTIIRGLKQEVKIFNILASQ
jgi:adenylate cyclase